MKCCICGKEIEKKYTSDGEMYWSRGNNAEPVKEGRCCDECNLNKVIPARISKVVQRRE